MCRAGFSLIELLVVLGIIAVIIGVTLPTISGVMETSRRVECASNLRTLGMGLSLYMESGDEMLPFARWAPDLDMDRDAPFDVIGHELDVPMPRFVIDEYSLTQPFACRSDPGVALETGFSYTYVPYVFFATLPEKNRRRKVTRMFTTNSWTILITDRYGFHRGGSSYAKKNGLRVDGSVGPIDDDRGFGWVE